MTPLKKLALILIVLIILIFWGKWYLEKKFLPEKIKTLTLSFLKEKLALDSSLKSVDFGFLKGIEITEFEINNPPEFGEEKLLRVKQLILKPALLPLLRKRLVISSIIIAEPKINLKRNLNGNWNIDTFIAPFSRKSEAADKSKQFGLQITKILIQEANIFFTDESVAPAFSRQIENFNLNVSPFGPGLALTYNLNCLIKPDETTVEAKGKFFLLGGKGGINLNLKHLNPVSFTPYLNKFTSFYFEKGYIDVTSELSFSKDELSGNGELNLSDVIFYLKNVYDKPLAFSSGKIYSRIEINQKTETVTLQNTTLSLGEIQLNGEGQIKTFKTTPELIFNFSTPLLDFKTLAFALPAAASDFYKSLNANGSFKISQGKLSVPFKNMSGTDYQLTAELQKAGVKLPFLKSAVNDMEGFLNLDRDKIETANLKARIENLPFALSGSRGFKSPKKMDLDLTFTQFSLGDLQKALKNNFPNFDLPLNFGGHGEGKLKITGEADKTNWQGSLRFIESEISGPKWTDKIKKVSGELDFSRDSLSSKAINGSWKDNAFTLSGTLQDFSKPHLKLKVTGGKINLNAEAKFLKDSGELVNLSGDYLGIPVKAQGKFKKLNPLTIDGKIESSPLDIEKLIEIFPPKLKETYKNLKLAGKIDFKTNLEGELLNWKKWKAGGSFYSSQIHISKFNFKEMSSRFSLAEQNLSLPDIKAVLSAGAVNGDFKINMAEAYPGFSGNLTLTSVDLARFSKETDWKDLDIQGLASGEINFNGFGSDWDRLKGRGWINLSGSRLWEIPLLGQLANILLIPGLDKTIIQQGHCTFNINQGRIYSKDIELLSENLSIKAEGSAGLVSQGLNFDILMQFSGALKDKASELTKLANLVLKTVEKLLVQIELRGTIKEPKYKVNPLPVDKILEREIKKKVGDFLQDLLEEKK